MSLHGGVLSRNKEGVFCSVYFVSEACWNKSVLCLTLKNRMSSCGLKKKRGAYSKIRDKP